MPPRPSRERISNSGNCAAISVGAGDGRGSATPPPKPLGSLIAALSRQRAHSPSGASPAIGWPHCLQVFISGTGVFITPHTEGIPTKGYRVCGGGFALTKEAD